MKILYVVPPFPNRIREYLILPSIELCINSKIMEENGHKVKLLDMKIDNLQLDKALEEVENYKPDVICIEDEPKTHCNTVKLIDLLKRNISNKVKIAVRGEIPSFVPESVMDRNKGIDFILRFDDDYTLLKILNSNFCEEELYRIPNIAFRANDGSYKITAVEKPSYPLDNLPMPKRELYNIQKYLNRDTETIVKSCRGCPGNCLFCIKTRFENFRLFSVQRFCDEIEEMLSYGFKSFFFADDTFAFSDKRLDEFYNEVKRRNLKFKWTSNIRISDINEKKLIKMKEIGAYRVFVGIETVNANTQKTINKNLNVELIKEKIKLLRKYDIEFHASFILGNPGDTEEDLLQTIEFVKEISPTIVTFNLIKVYPGLDLYNNPDKYDIIMDDTYWYEKDTWSQKVVMGTKQLPPEILEKWSRRCLMEFIL